MSTSALQEERVPVASRVWISLADASVAILQGLVGAAVTYYFVSIRGLTDQYYWWAWAIYLLWNTFNDPLFGYISDRTKSKLGRRIPYIRYGAPIFVLGFIMFWLDVPGLNTQFGIFLQMVLALFIYDSLYTAIATSLYIMPYEVAISNKARSSIFIWKIIFSVFTIVTPLAIEATIKPQVGDVAGISFFRWFMILFSIGMGIIIFVSTFFYKEKHYAQEGEQPGFLDAIKQCFRNRSFVVFEVLSFTIIFVQAALMQGLWYYFDAIKIAREPLYIALAAGIVIGVFLWINRREPWGVKFSTRTFSLLFAIGCFIVLLFGRNVIAATIGFFIFGLGFAGGMYLIPLMNGDVVDMDEHRTGLRREGMYAGINSFVTKWGMLANPIMISIMTAYGYNKNLPINEQVASVGDGIILGWMLIPGVLLFISFLALHWYPLDGPDWLGIKSKLAEVHKAKERKYLESQGYKFVD